MHYNMEDTLIDQDCSQSSFGAFEDTVFIDPAQAGNTGCKWCLRSWSNINPIRNEREQGKEFLQRRNGRSFECKSCPQVLGKKTNAKTGANKNDEQKQVNEEGPRRKAHLAEVMDHEAVLNGDRPRKRQSSAVTTSQINNNVYTGFEGKLFNGIFVALRDAYAQLVIRSFICLMFPNPSMRLISTYHATPINSAFQAPGQLLTSTICFTCLHLKYNAALFLRPPEGNTHTKERERER